MRSPLLALFLGLALPIATQAADPAQTATGAGAARVTVAEQAPYGRYIADSEGRALYMFTADRKGETNCYDKCAQAWPPLKSQGEPAAGDNVNAEMLDTVARKDGANQVTYNGWPLYYFVQDQGPGQVTGQDKHGFGGEWYLVSPAGNKITAEEKASAQ